MSPVPQALACAAGFRQHLRQRGRSFSYSKFVGSLRLTYDYDIFSVLSEKVFFGYGLKNKDVLNFVNKAKASSLEGK